MDDKNKKVITTRKVIVTNKPKEEVKPNTISTNNIQDEGVSQNLDAHLQENINAIEKKPINWMNVLTYFIMVIIVVGALVLVYFFLDKNGMNPFVPKETTTTVVPTNMVSTTRQSQITKITETTTTVAKKAVNHVPGSGSGSGTPSVRQTQAVIHVSTTAHIAPAKTYSITIEGGRKLYFYNMTKGVPVSREYELNKGTYYLSGHPDQVFFTIDNTIHDAKVTCVVNTDETISCNYVDLSNETDN